MILLSTSSDLMVGLSAFEILVSLALISQAFVSLSILAHQRALGIFKAASSIGAIKSK